MPLDPLERKLDNVRRLVRGRGRALVAFSGGVDSTLVLRLAADAAADGGEPVLAVTGRSPAVPASELAEAVELAERIGVEHRILDTDELSSPGYVANEPDRCYHCKTELFGRLEELRNAEGFSVVLDGTNAEDLDDHRPGWAARRENRVLSPLAEAGLGKDEIREASRRLGLPTASKPALACLASRIPYGTPVTPERLAQVEAAEACLAGLGFRQFRVRHHEEVARIELDPAEMGRLDEPGVREEVVRGVKAAGYRWVAVDLEGYRTGSLNEVLVTKIVPNRAANARPADRGGDGGGGSGGGHDPEPGGEPASR
jgi:uncharacterized protein